MKKILFTLCLLVQAYNISAQTPSAREQFLKMQQDKMSQFKEEAKREKESFLEQRNAIYAEYMAKKWELYKAFTGEEPPQRDYPKDPVVVPENQPNIAPAELPIKKIVKLPQAQPLAPQFRPIARLQPEEEEEEFTAPTPSAPIGQNGHSTIPSGGNPALPTAPIVPVAPTINPRPIDNSPIIGDDFKFTFIGSQLSVSLTDEHRISLSGVREREVSRGWKQLTESSIETVVAECLYWKERLMLNDYLYVLMLDQMCDKFFGTAAHNESRLLKTYILAQSGYDVKNARCSAGLVVLLNIEESIYQKTYLNIDNNRYYIIDEPKGSDKQYYTFSQKFADESKSCSMRIIDEFVVNRDMTQSKRLTARNYPSISVETSVDKNLIELYNNYPRCSWEIYATAPMSSTLTAMIMPTLRAEIEGKTEREAANMILNFVQTAFEYKTDDAYFGYERSLFVDETFYYSYSDCEDRSILYANLMRNLLGVEVVLLHYPNHLATAVLFEGSYSGDHIMIEGKKYLICDPTYIGANIGKAMPQFKSVEAEVVML